MQVAGAEPIGAAIARGKTFHGADHRRLAKLFSAHGMNVSLRFEPEPWRAHDHGDGARSDGLAGE